MSTPVAIVTGAAKGIGREIAAQLAAKGFDVIIAARNASAGKSAAAAIGANCRSVVMDVSDSKSIAKAADEIRRMTSRVDVIVNNAAVLLDDNIPLTEAPADLVEVTFKTNVLGPLHVTQALLPLMPAGARVIMVSSGGGVISEGVGGWAPVYCASKTALNGVTLQLAHALRSKKIAVNAYCPGWVRTDMGGASAPRTVAQGADTAVWLATEAPEKATGKIFRDRKEIDW